MSLTVLITGASRGIGEAIKLRFIREGFNVLSPTREELDLSSDELIINYLSTIKIPIDILINNAGINHLEELIELDTQSLISTFQVNCFAPFLISKYVIENSFLPRGNGSIVNIASIWINYTKKGRAAYSMSKSALHALTKSIAVEYGSNNIRCNTISPGFVGTELTYANNSQNDINKIVDHVPLKRLANPEEIADLIFYVSVKNQFINGENIFIDGGVTKKY